MLEDQVAYLLQRYLGNYVRGLSKEALKISVWNGDVELTNMQLKPEALNALKLPIKVKAGFLGSVKIKVPWSRLGQDPVLVYLDRIFLLAEPATQVEGGSEDAVQEAKRNRIREMEIRLLEKAQHQHHLKTEEANKSWLGSLLSTIIGNLKLSISNIHIRYEDGESNPGHPFAVGATLDKLSAFTVDDNGNETFATGGALDYIQKSVELERLALYFDSDIYPWHLDKSWEDLHPSEWSQVFKFGTKDSKVAGNLVYKHSYIIEPISGNAKYSKLRADECLVSSQPLQKATVNLDDVTICLSKDGYTDMVKLADNFAAFNQRLKYAHYRPLVSVRSDPWSWWKYAFKAVSDQLKKASGRLSWEQVLRYTKIRKKYISLYAARLKSDSSRAVVDNNKEIEELDRELDIDLIIQWRMVAHRFVEQSVESSLRKQRDKKSWWSFGWGSESPQDESETLQFSEEDWEKLNRIIGYKEGDYGGFVDTEKDVIHTAFEVYMRRNASKLIDAHECVAELSCERLECSGSLYSEAKTFDLKLGSYRLSSPCGLLAESAAAHDSLVGTFVYKPFDVDVDWSLVAKASPCYMTYLKDSFEQIVKFFGSTAVSHTLAVETAAAVQMTIDGMKRTAQEQMSRALKDQSRFLLDLDIAAPKITIPTEFCPDSSHPSKLMLDLGNLIIHTKDDHGSESPETMNLYLQFDMVLRDISAFLVDGDFSWSKSSLSGNPGSTKLSGSLLPVIDKCAVILRLQQIKVHNPLHPSTRVAVRVPSLGFQFSPARYHRLMQVVKIFEDDDDKNSEPLRPWNQADFEGWLSLLTWKGVANREAVWQQRYFCLVGLSLYILENPASRSYKQFLSLRGKLLYMVPPEIVGDEEHVLAICDATTLHGQGKVVEQANALILCFDSGDSESIWHSRLQSAIYRTSISVPITTPSESSSDPEDLETETVETNDAINVVSAEKIFITGVLDELKVCFHYNKQCEQSFMKMLLSEEKHLFELRAKGGLVEIAIKENDMFIGTVLKSLEIEDLVCGGTSQHCYLARSFIWGTDVNLVLEDTVNQSCNDPDLSTEGDEFYEAPEILLDTDSPTQSSGNVFEASAFKSPRFTRVPGLLPDSSFLSTAENMGKIGVLDNFVKAQIVMYDQNSPLYSNTDKMVVVTLATLSFFSRRPTIAAIMEFVNDINFENESCESFSDGSSMVTAEHAVSGEDVDQRQSSTGAQPVKGLLGKGKFRIIFYLVLNMARVQIVLVKEDETKLATLSQDNLLTDIKVFPSSFSIKAAIGNLKISDDSLPPQHSYFWACDMRNPGGSSFVEVAFASYNPDDDDYKGYDYSLSGQLSEVRIVFLNRFVQEVVSYVTGLAPSTSNGVVKLRDQVTDTEKWFTTSEIEGSPAVKLDLSLTKPIIIMPRRTDSLDYLELDVVHITVQNTFQWSNGTKHEMSAVHMEILTVLVEDINLNVGTGKELGDSIIQEVSGFSVVIRRSLRDLLHQIPSTEAKIEMNVLKAALSNREYEIITECALSNISETPNIVSPLKLDKTTSYTDTSEPAAASELGPTEAESSTTEVWISMKVIVAINLAELSLHKGTARDAPLATVQINNAWLFYKSTTAGDGFVSVTLRSFNVLDDREGTQEQFRLAIGQPKSLKYSSSHLGNNEDQHVLNTHASKEFDAATVVATMLIFDAKFSEQSSSICLCVQRPQLLVALDFLMAVMEFFVPTVRGMLASEEDDISMNLVDAIILNESTYLQPSSEFSISPLKPLVIDSERFDNFIYDGNGGKLLLKDRYGSNIFSPSAEAIIYVGKGKRLQFKNVHIKDGRFLDSCIVLGADSSYSVAEDDHVVLECGVEELSPGSSRNSEVANRQNTESDKCSECVIEFQVINPELTFYNSSSNVGESLILSNKLLHAQLDAFCRIAMKGEAIEITANALGLTMESNGFRILEPVDTSIKYSNVAGKTSIHLSASDIYMNFSFSILRLFLAVEEDMLAFLRTTSRKMTISCSEFDKVAMIEYPNSDQVHSFWRARAPPGFAVLGDYLTTIDKPPTKAVLAINMNLVKIKRPESFKLIWPHIASVDTSNSEGISRMLHTVQRGASCSIWYPVAPKGYIALGCVVSSGTAPPSLSSSFCILASLVSSCSMRDCIMIGASNECQAAMAFWRVDNCIGTFLPTDPTSMKLIGGTYDLGRIFFGASEFSQDVSNGSHGHVCSSNEHHPAQSTTANSGWHFEAVASFCLVWWSQGSNSRKKLSIWRPVVPQGMVYFGDIAVKGYEPPNTCVVVEDIGDELFKEPLDFQMVGKIKRQRGMEPVSFWLPQAPPGYVPLGCVACKGSPKNYEFRSLRCIRSDMITGAKFSEESVWDTHDAGLRAEPFSIWTVGDELGTFLVRSGYKKPPKRFAVKLADKSVTSGPENTVVDAEIRTFSAACFDDFGGLMVPLFNLSLSGIGLSLHARPEYINSTVSFSLVARSYNDKYEVWEPVVEAVEGFLRYQYDLNLSGAASQLRLTSTKDLNLNVSSSNANMILQAYASWNNLSEVHESYVRREAASPIYKDGSLEDVHHKRNYYIIPQNKLGQDIFIRATEVNSLSRLIRMPSGDTKPLKIPVSKNMPDSHIRGTVRRQIHSMVSLIIAEAQFQRELGLSSHQYAVAIRLSHEPVLSDGTFLNDQSARTFGCSSEFLSSFGLDCVKWNEVFFFKVDSLDSYRLELTLTDMGKGDPVGFFSAPLKEMVALENAYSHDYINEWNWIDLSPPESKMVSNGEKFKGPQGRLKLAVILSSKLQVEDSNQSSGHSKKNGFIQISPAREGPWTTVRLNYAAPAACWRLDSAVVASEVHVKDGNRYVNIRSLVSVRNETDFALDVCLKSKALSESNKLLNDATFEKSRVNDERIETVEFFEIELYVPTVGWACCSGKPSNGLSAGGMPNKEIAGVESPTDWDWVDEWHLEQAHVGSIDGWVYAPDQESLKWPESYDTGNYVNHARQRRWIRNRKQISSDVQHHAPIGVLKPGDSIPLPLSCLTQAGQYILQLRPLNFCIPDEYAWNTVVDKPEESEICVSDLEESMKLLYCAQIGGTSSSGSHGIWFCLSVQAVEIAKDIHSDPIQDWSLVVKSPLSIVNYLPLKVEYSILERQSSGHLVARSRGIFSPGKTVNVYSADVTSALFLSLLPQKGWLLMHEAVPISQPSGMQSRTLNLRSSISGRTVQVVLEQNHDKGQVMMPNAVRIFAPYWFSVSRCPPLTFRLVDTDDRKPENVFRPLKSRKNNLEIFGQITDDEFHEGYTIASSLNFRAMGLQTSIAHTGEDIFGPIKDLSPLGDMDGSVDLSAYDPAGNCMRLCITSKPCPYQSIPTKVISIRPFMTFTNRLGQDIFIKLSVSDEPKVLRLSDSRVCFVYQGASESDKLQVCLADTKWSFPVEIVKEDTFSLVLRKENGERVLLRTEVRGYEEGSRFIVVFRLGSANGPIRIENRTRSMAISICQLGFDDDHWIYLKPLSTTNFSWDDPYGQKSLNVRVCSGSSFVTSTLNLETTTMCSLQGQTGVQFHMVDSGDMKVARFTEELSSGSSLKGDGQSVVCRNWGSFHMQRKVHNTVIPSELTVEFGMLGLSLVDHRPRELAYLYLERVYIAYSTGYDGGTTSRFKLILGHLHVDNQLPLTVMPVLLAPEQTDIQQPVFKMKLTMQKENTDGIQVYPYIYIRVTEKCWRLNIHEPMIWALMDFYNNLQLDRLPESPNVTQVDPEIRINLIDVSEVRFKVSLETAPAQRPHGVLGVWSPILSAVGNAFKIQIHLRKVIHTDRFMRKSAVISAITDRIWRDLIHNPLHLIFSVDVLGMTRSTLASLSKGFAELSTDGQFLQLRSKQVRSRRITGVGDGIMQGTGAFAQAVAFGVSGVVRKPVESTRQNGVLGLAHGLGRAFVGFIVQPVSGALDFLSLTVDGIGASCARCFQVLTNRTTIQRVRIPRAMHSDGILREYNEREAVGQMMLYLAEESHHMGCTKIFNERSKFALSDYYEHHFILPRQRIVLVTNKRVMLLQCKDPDNMDKKPSKILWDVPWEELLALELAKAGSHQPSHLILHLKNFKRSEPFAQVIKSKPEEESESESSQAVKICSAVRKMWKAYQSDTRSLKVPSSQRSVHFSWSEAGGRGLDNLNKAIALSRDVSLSSSVSDETSFVERSIDFSKLWSNEQKSKDGCTLCRKKALEDGAICSIWRPACPSGYVSTGDIARVGTHPPNVAAVYLYNEQKFALPMGFDLVWRNCEDDYGTPVSIWLPRAPEGFVALGCIAVAGFSEPEPTTAFCVAESLVEEAEFEAQTIWSVSDSYPWACYIYQVLQSNARHFVALRQPCEESGWKPKKLRESTDPPSSHTSEGQ